MRKLIIVLAGFIVSLAVITACQGATPLPPPSPTPPPAVGKADSPPPLDPQRVAQGKELYAQNCAACHGPNGEGQPDWQIPNEDGSFKPPPHDNTGHTWHHDDDLLFSIVVNGGSMPQSQMPAFGDKLSDDDIRAILEYIKSWWGPDQRTFQWQVTRRVREQQQE